MNFYYTNEQRPPVTGGQIFGVPSMVKFDCKDVSLLSQKKNFF